MSIRRRSVGILLLLGLVLVECRAKQVVNDMLVKHPARNSHHLIRFLRGKTDVYVPNRQQQLSVWYQATRFLCRGNCNFSYIRSVLKHHTTLPHLDMLQLRPPRAGTQL